MKDIINKFFFLSIHELKIMLSVNYKKYNNIIIIIKIQKKIETQQLETNKNNNKIELT